MPPEAAAEEEPGIDPFADLLFALIAMVLPAILVLLPALHLGAVRRPAAEAAPTTPPSPAVTVGGHPAATIVAEAGGLRLASAGNRRIPLDAVPDDRALRDALAALRAAETPLLVLIEPAGLEAAFLLEPVAAAHGPVRIAQLRTATPCAEARDPALARACALPPGTGAR
ncbi:hypothetical protein BHAOGJBA_4982 [Methylobacterium hispanicum]|jgi:hypothetical protein|uniref:Biopolymer transporter ExbD n=1 Tax=Methylobacterium hispanicum TaxID=270350 RepID=A0AAV4ZTG7_9HYPH|nr:MULTISPECIES: hypothetical protein [Methylobacterium]GJD91434.1 hypothetical protein BHAOGJBA_4982 [Methylobacterium hispanicum]